MQKSGFFKSLVLLFAFGFIGSVAAQNYQLHVVYIYSFIRYIQWPNPEGDFVIGIFGDSPIIEHLEKMAAAKKAGDRVIRIKKFNTLEGLTKTDILFIAESSSDKLASVIDKIGSAHTLLITEKEGMGVEGSAINFVTRDGKLAFELNRDSMSTANLKVSTELTRLAIIL